MASRSDRRIRDDFRPKDIILYRLARILLHQRHVLVGGTMKHHIRPLFFESGIDPRLIADVRKARPDIRPDPALAQLAIDLKERILSPLDEHQPPRTKFHRLATNFRTD